MMPDDEVVAGFARDGVACLRSVLEPGEVAEAAVAIDAVLARPGPLAQVASAPDDPGAFPEDGCLELVGGSHRGPWLMPRTFLRKEARWFPEGSLAELPDIDADPHRFDIRRFELQPGDAVFFDFLTVHGAPGFPHRGRRRILSLRYLSAAARHAPRTWRTSPPFDDLDAELPAGAPMDHPLFPVVWPAS